MTELRTRRTLSRRQWTMATGGTLLLSGIATAVEPSREADDSLAGAMGIVTASAHAQLQGRGKGRNFSLLELPRILSNELGMRVIDLNTSSFPDFADVDGHYLGKLRAAVDNAGCILTNLKMNQRDIDMASPDRETRRRAVAEYKRSIDIAAELGCRWARPLPAANKPDMRWLIESYRELCDYGARKKVQLLVENFGWMQADPASVSNLVKSIGHNIAAGVDTGNWDSRTIRIEGLRKSFPLAVTCDFKARQMGPGGEHSAYNLHQCFRLAWENGFRGPWALEHGHTNTAQLLRDWSILRDHLQNWTKTAQANERGSSE